MWAEEKWLTLIGNRAMRKIVLALAVLVVAFSSCNKLSQEKVPIQKKTSIRVGIDEAVTKTSLTGTIDLLWEAGDKILVTASDYQYKVFTLEGEGGSATGTFSINEEMVIMGGDGGSMSFYPETLSPRWDDGTHNNYVTLPDTYIWSEAGVKAPMYAWLNKTDPWDYFKLLTSVLKVDLYNIPATADKLVFTTAGEVLSGEFVFPGDCIPVSTGSENKSVTIAFTAGSKSERTFCIPVPWGSYSAGAKIELKNSSNETLVTVTAPALTVKKESFAYLPAVNCSNTEKVVTTIWEGERTVVKDGDNWSNVSVPVDPEIWKTVPVGTKVMVTVKRTPASDDSVIELVCQYDDWKWQMLISGGTVPTDMTTLNFVLTEDVLGYLTNNCKSFLLNGFNFIVYKVELELPKPERIVWTGSVNLYDGTTWKQVYFPTGFMNNVSNGTVVTVYFDENAQETSWREARIKALTSPDWTTIEERGHNADGRRFACFILDSMKAEQIRANGMDVEGSGLTVTKITLR